MSSAHDHASHEGHGTVKTLMTGFVLAAILTIIPFGLVMADAISSKTLLISIIMICAVAQILVHLRYFLLLTSEQEHGFTMASALLALILLLIVLAGSLWVMHNMNKYMMPLPESGYTIMDDGTIVCATPEIAEQLRDAGVTGNIVIQNQ
ncbi:cytochrome o ubiquinol oxidase subunit IV [Martelella mediterranea]|uniref:Cytochrome bo(3) ubiquinol oxidase subunit 4 n=1 Tax=Martelella mediterranea TaxID=293089 RepID=A0A4R3P1V8_9HYPH|nr:cytochrome o ubiquinol oxidase subunit IV [Martelella mediterranea]TCT44518.1 cytochrome bo3 quinol oxidase subunit 4 [Martelella mediterranea]